MENSTVTTSTATERRRAKLFSGMRENKKYIAKASAAALLFWLAQFLYHFYVVTPGDVSSAIIRSFSFSGATLIGLALLVGPLSRLTKYNFVFHRRTLGVWGFTFGIMHYLSVQAFIFHFDVQAMLAITNPYINPPIFGLIAFLLFMPLYLTSTDFALQRLGYRKWKRLHALAYPAYILLILHFWLFSPYGLLNNFSGYLLLIVTVLAVGLQLAGFVKTIMRTRSRAMAALGMLIIIIGLYMLYLAFVQNSLIPTA